MPFHFIDSHGELDLDQFVIDPPAGRPALEEPIKEGSVWHIGRKDSSQLPIGTHSEHKIDQRIKSRLGQQQDHSQNSSFVAISPHLLIKHIMTTDVETLEPDAPLKLAIDLFDRYSFQHIPVISFDHQLVGVISNRDILKRLYRHPSDTWAAFYDTPIKSVMSTPVLSAAEDTPIQEVAELLASYGIGALPIVKSLYQTEKPTLSGIITKSDLYQLIISADPLL